MTSKWYNSNDAVVGKIILKTVLANTSPLILGSGEQERSDVDCIKMYDGSAYIPGSVIAGCLRSTLSDQKIAEEIWGTEGKAQKRDEQNEDSSFQSHIIIEDALITKETQSTFSIKEGVRIDYVSNQARDQGLFDYEILEPGSKFEFVAEMTIRRSMQLSTFKEDAFRIASIIEKDFRIGAKTNSGFGKLSSVEKVQIYYFDFHEKEDRAAWFTYIEDGTLSINPLIYNSVELDSGYNFQVVADFRIKTSLLSRTYTIKAEAPDHVHTFRGDNAILHGTSIKGAIRHRARKILQTVLVHQGVKNASDTSTKLINRLFGYVDDDKKDTRAIRGRIRVEESILKNVEKDQVQTRIKIDRFTGGTIDGALIASKPVWNKTSEEQTSNLTIKWAIKKAQDYEITLLLMVLKDLWTADLAIAGDKAIGRGVLEGISAKVYIENQKITIDQSEESNGSLNISEDGFATLKKYNTWNIENWSELIKKYAA